MKLKMGHALLGVIPLLASCAGQPVRVAAVGPAPYTMAASSDRAGQLQVFSETEEYEYDESVPYYPHRDYMILTMTGKRLKHVWNYQNHEDELPAIISLPAGKYLVTANAEQYGPVQVPVVIKPGEMTRVVLQPGWNPGTAFASTDLVQMPKGYFIGWRAQLPAGE